MSAAHVNLLGPLSRSQMDLALSLAAVAAGVTLAPDTISGSSFAAVQFSRAPIATSVDPAGSAGDPDGARGSHHEEGDQC